MSSIGVETLDVRDLDSDIETFGKRLCRAWTETGFVIVTGHSVDLPIAEACFTAARRFFALPLNTKLAYQIRDGGGQRGYTPFGIETAKDATLPDLKEFWHVGRELPNDHPAYDSLPPNIWPSEVDAFRKSCDTFYQSLDVLGRKLLMAVAVQLGENTDYFEPRVALGNSILRLLHYPPCDGSAAGERAAAHEDINVITLLVGADQDGLEIQRRDGSWTPVQVAPGEIVCNVGDMLERLTNDVLRSTTHRVVRPESTQAAQSRFSAPYFLHFAPEVEIRSLPSCMSADHPNRYATPITAERFLAQRLAEIGLT